MSVILDPRHFREPDSFQHDLLWVINADSIPPHIGLSVNGQFFSLKYNGKDSGVPVERLVEIFRSKKIKVLLFKIGSVDDILLNRVFSEFECTVPGQITCLQPIKEILKLKADTIHDLLQELSVRNEIEAVYQLNIDKDFKGIPEYTLDDIYHHLLKLEHVQG